MNQKNIYGPCLILFVTSMLVLTGCTPNNKEQNQAPEGIQPAPEANSPQQTTDQASPQNDNHQWQGPGRMSNMTQEQRQQFMDQRIKQATEACQQKTEGDTCSIQTPRGERTGTCKTRNETLLCNTMRMRDGQNSPEQQPPNNPAQ